MVWDITRLDSAATWLDHHPTESLAASRDGGLFAAASIRGDLSAWEVRSSASGAPVTALKWSRPAEGAVVTALRFSPDGRTLAAVVGGSRVQLFDARSGRPLGSPLRHRGEVSAMQFSADGRLLATGAHDGAARVWDVATRRLRGYPMPHAGEALTHVAFSDDASLLLTGANRDRASTIRLWYLEGNEEVAKLPAGDRLALADFTADGGIVAAFDTTIARWSLKPGSPAAEDGAPAYTAELKGRLKFGTVVWCAGLSPERSRLVAGGLDGTARVITVADLRPTGEPMRSAGVVEGVEFSADGRWVVSLSADRTARIWDGRTGYPVADGSRHDAHFAGLVGGGAYFLSAGRSSSRIRLEPVALDFPAPAPQWMAQMVEAAGGGRFEQEGTLSWIADRDAELAALRARVGGEGGSSWWYRWAGARLPQLVQTPGAGTGAGARSR
jgi:WD40 repeat protein